MNKNRYLIMQNLEGVQAQLKAAVEHVDNLFSSPSSTVAERTEAENKVADLKNRVVFYQNELKELDQEAMVRMQDQSKPENLSKEEKVIKAKADLIRNTIAGKVQPREVLNALGDGSSLGNGQKILPTTLMTELVAEPYAKNPLRGVSKFTNITNLEVPKITFTLENDDFLAADNETAKEMKASASIITFERKKFKVFADVTETVLRGTDTNLVAHVENALKSGMARKEKKIAFTEGTNAADTSFYNKTSNNYDIKTIQRESLYLAIKAALADLEDEYADNAKIVMKKSDYFDLIEALANENATLYQAQPETILGAPVIFCDLATVPIVGDFSYSQFNYDLDATYESDKNIKTGITSFVLTAYLDHKILMKSAFRLAKVTP